MQLLVMVLAVLLIGEGHDGLLHEVLEPILASWRRQVPDQSVIVRVMVTNECASDP
jgi:hypothetical protein